MNYTTLSRLPLNNGFGGFPRAETAQNLKIWTIKVLLVENDPADTSLILNALTRHPDVSEARASDAPDRALLWLAAGRMRPDLVLVDINMPRIDGFKFIEGLREIRAMAKTPVVILTTSCLASDVMKAQHLSACHYIVKASSYGDLQNRLDDVIQRTLYGAWST